MRSRASWLVIMSIGCLLGGAISRAATPDHPLNPVIRFELYRDYLIVLQVRVGPLKGLNFLLDTGASPSVVDPRIAAKLHLETVPTEIAVLQGTARGATATIPSLQVGPVLKENLPVLVEDLSFVQKVVPVHLDGIIGLDVLGESPFTIDYTTREIRFGPLDRMSGSIPLEFKHGLAILHATLNQQSVQLLLDTGAPSVILFKGQALAGIRTVNLDVSSGAIGDHDERPSRLSSLALGAANFSHPLAYLVASPRDAAHDFGGVVSPAALGINRLGVDVPGAQMAISRSF